MMNRSVCQFPKRLIPVRVGVGSPSLLLLDLSWFVLLLLPVLPFFTSIFRANLGQIVFAQKVSYLPTWDKYISGGPFIQINHNSNRLIFGSLRSEVFARS